MYRSSYVLNIIVDIVFIIGQQDLIVIIIQLNFRNIGYIGSFKILSTETFYDAYRRLKQQVPNSKASSNINLAVFNKKKL